MMDVNSLVYGIMFLGIACTVLGIVTAIMSMFHLLDAPLELEEEMTSFDLFASLDKSVSKKEL